VFLHKIGLGTSKKYLLGGLEIKSEVTDVVEECSMICIPPPSHDLFNHITRRKSRKRLKTESTLFICKSPDKQKNERKNSLCKDRSRIVFGKIVSTGPRSAICFV
jgi:hypothetical protein